MRQAESIQVPGTTSGGSSRNRIRVEFNISSDNKTVGISFSCVRVRVGFRGFNRAVAQKIGEIPATGGARALRVSHSGNTVEITLVGAHTQPEQDAVKIGTAVLQKAMEKLTL